MRTRPFQLLLVAVTLLLLLPHAALRAQSAQQAFSTAVTTYKAGKFAQAHDEFNELRHSFGPNPVYSFNAGNAAYAAGKFPEAVLRYQEALELDPNFAPARQNLALVQAEAQALRPSPDMAARFRRDGVDAFVIGAMLLGWLGLACAAILFARALRKRPGLGWPGGLAALFLVGALALVLLASRQWARHSTEQIGVVVNPVGAFSEISETGVKVEDLVPATSVLVQSKRGSQIYALLPSGKQAWIQADAVQLVERRESL